MKMLGTGAVGAVGLAGVTTTGAAVDDINIETAYSRHNLVRPGEELSFHVDYNDDAASDHEFEVHYCEDYDCDETELVEVLTESTEYLRASYDEPGTYEVWAIVWSADDPNRGAVKDFHFVVRDEDEANFPEAEVDVDKTEVEVGEEVTLDGSGSSWDLDIPGTEITSYGWGGDVYAAGEQTTVSFDEPGTKTVELNVIASAPKEEFDDMTLHEDPTATASTETEIEVVEAAGEIEAVVDISDDEPDAGQAVTFDASQSSSPNGEIVAYRWTFQHDDGSDEGVSVERSWDEEGEFGLALEIEDEDGETAQEVTTIEVGGAWSPW